MMTSATLVEALRAACDEWLQERGKSKITDLDEKERIKNIRIYCKSFVRFIFQEIVHVCLGKHLGLEVIPLYHPKAKLKLFVRALRLFPQDFCGRKLLFLQPRLAEVLWKD